LRNGTPQGASHYKYSVDPRAAVHVDLGADATGRQLGGQEQRAACDIRGGPGLAHGNGGQNLALISSVSLPAVMSVVMQPSQIAFTRILSGASSRAIALVSPSPPALAAE
jgi:hypothetical protein